MKIWITVIVTSLLFAPMSQGIANEADQLIEADQQIAAEELDEEDELDEADAEFVRSLLGVTRNQQREYTPNTITRYEYEAITVYYVTPLNCCDLYNSVIDAEGNVLCHPDGGMTNAGDGRCPDFHENKKNGKGLYRFGDKRPSD